jgi:hypothetical protein
MAPSVCIAGPAFDPEREEMPPQYRRVIEAAKNEGWAVNAPIRDRGVDGLSTTQFAEFMLERIGSADIVVAFLAKGDQSVPVEATMAAFMRKDQLVVAEDPYSVPRVLSGLPGITAIVHVKDDELLYAALRQMIGRGEAAGPTATA